MAHRSFLFAPSSGLAPVFGLRREIDRLFDDAFGGPGGERGNRPTFAPPVDVREDEREILIQVDLPGVQPEQVEISLENGMLTVRGERRQERKEGDERRWHVMERTHGVFVRTFQLPAGVDESRIVAEFDDGVLTIHVPKPAQPQPRRIEVGRGAQRNVGAGAAGAGTAGRAASGAETGTASGGPRGTRAGGSGEGARAEPMVASDAPSASRGEPRPTDARPTDGRQGEGRQGEPRQATRPGEGR